MPAYKKKILHLLYVALERLMQDSSRKNKGAVRPSKNFWPKIPLK